MWTDRAVRNRVGFQLAFKRASCFGAAVRRAREIAKEAVQEAHCRSLRHTQRFCSEAHYRAWLCRAAANVVSDYFRRDRRLRQAEADSFPAPSCDSFERDEGLRWAMEQLAKEDQGLLHRYYFNDMTYEQIAVEYRRSPTWVCIRMRSAGKRLRHLLTTQGFA
jgi:RNA polymerase sigma factor (sigma-70 family)